MDGARRPVSLARHGAASGVHPSRETRKWVTVLERRTDAPEAIPKFQPGVQGGRRAARLGRGEGAGGGQRAAGRAEADLPLVAPVRRRRSGCVAHGGAAGSAAPPPARRGDERGADRGAGAQGRPAGAGAGFFRASLAASRGGGPAERRAWRRSVFAVIEATTRPQGALPIAAACGLAGVSRATYYRHWHAVAPREETTALRDVLQRLALAHRHYGYRRLTALVRREGWRANHKRVLRLLRT